MRRSLVLVFLAVLLGAPAAHAAATPRTFTPLVMPVLAPGETAPWTTAEIAAAFKGGPRSLDGYLQLQTGGAWRVEPTVLPWTTLSSGMCGTYTPNPNAVARAAGVDMLGRRPIVVLTARTCGERGSAYIGGDFIWLYGNLHADAIAHEFGHTLGLPHANRLVCRDAADRLVTLSGACTPREYGDMFDTMGAPLELTLLSTWNRLKLGILAGSDRQVRTTSTVTLDAASTSGTTLIRIPRKRAGVPVTESYALELRDGGAVWDAFVPRDGLLVRIVPRLGSETSPLLVDMHPGTGLGWGEDAPLRVGERFEDPKYGIALRLLSVVDGKATVEIAAPGLPDDIAPPVPGVGARRATGGIEAEWMPVEDDDSGLAGYRLERDGVLIATLGPEARSYLDPVAGAHTYALRAVDAAGNVSAASSAENYWPPEEPPRPPAPPATARDRVKPTFTLTPKVGKRAVRLPGRKLKIAARDDRPGVRVTATVSGRKAKLSKGVLRLSAAQARRSTVKITVTDAAGNRATTTLKVRSGRATRSG